MSMISNEVLRIQPNREKAVIRVAWGDTEVDVFALVELAIWKAENKCVNSMEETRRYALTNINNFTKNVDIGCMQINFCIFQI